MAYVRVSRQPRVVGLPGPPGPLGAPAGPVRAEVAPTRAATAGGSAAGGTVAERPYWIAGYGLIVVGVVAGLSLQANLKPAEFKPAQGFDSFAVLYIVAQSLERLFEPIVNFVRGSVGGGASVTKSTAIAERDAQLATAVSSGDDVTLGNAVAAATKAQATIDQIRANAAILLFGGQSALGMAASGAFGLFLLRGVGASAVPVGLDMFVTGIAIGGGSKALHDLIKSVQTTKERKQDPAEAGGVA